MMFLVGCIVGMAFGVVTMGVMSARAYDKGYSDCLLKCELREDTVLDENVQ